MTEIATDYFKPLGPLLPEPLPPQKRINITSTSFNCSFYFKFTEHALRQPVLVMMYFPLKLVFKAKLGLNDPVLNIMVLEFQVLPSP